jgi:transketolase
MKSTLLSELYDLLHKNNELFIFADLKKNPDFKKIAEDFHDRFTDINKNESSTLSICASLLAQKKSIILCVTIPHFIVRWYEQLITEIGNKTQPFIIIGIPAEEHKWGSLRPEIALNYTIPNLNIVAPATRQEIGNLLAQVFISKKSFYIHIDTLSSYPIETETKDAAKLSIPLVYSKGSQAACIGVGNGLSKALQAKLYLESYGYSGSLISMHTIKPLNTEELLKIIHSYSAIFVFEELDSPLSVGKLLGSFIAENATRAILFRAFSPNSNEQNGPYLPSGYADKKLNMRSCTLEIIELMIHFNIIPTHPSWHGK